VEEALDVFRMVLPIPVEKDHNLAPGLKEGRLQGGSIAPVGGVGKNPGSRSPGLMGGPVGGAVIDHQEFVIGIKGADPKDDPGDRFLHIVGGDQNADRRQGLHRIAISENGDHLNGSG
jgi:hypothetical protein